jgi:hypothetical protein
MNDPQIRKAFHNTFLREQHNESKTLVIDELGLEHGKCRADIAVINGRMDGYEIKSDVDSLSRFNNQINSYDAIFDHSTVVLTNRHLNMARQIIPDWWGIIVVIEANSTVPHFKEIRTTHQNIKFNNYSVAQLLWRKEAQELLFNLGIRGNQLRQKRSILYSYIVEMLDPNELRYTVREYLKQRQGWRHPAQLILSGD